METVLGEVTGLPIPAHAEIALEGFVTTDEYRKEGPYGEWPLTVTPSRPPVVRRTMEFFLFIFTSSS
ncbi:MAG: UbiD family decarboxylase domain-containing protein [Candidatus Poribacteria bacterium]